MIPRERVWLGVLVALSALAVVTFGVWSIRAGALSISLREAGPHGDRIQIWVPGAVIEGAIFLLPDAVIEHASEEALNWVPVARRMMAEFDRLPDFPIVRVESGRECVLIEKEGRQLLIDVTDAGDKVRLRIPTGIVRAALRRLDHHQGSRSESIVLGPI